MKPFAGLLGIIFKEIYAFVLTNRRKMVNLNSDNSKRMAYMKRCFVLGLILLFLCTVAGCKENKNTESDLRGNVSGASSDVASDNRVSDGENTSTQPQGSADDDSNPQTGKDNTQSIASDITSGGKKPQSTSGVQGSTSDTDNKPDTSSSSTVSGGNDVDTSKCEHKKERTEYKAPTCVKDGYYKYICEACGNVRTKEVPAEHKFSNYICTECGIADKENAVRALNSWTEKNGKRKDSISPYEYSFKAVDGDCTLSSFTGELTLSFLSTSESTQEKIDIVIYNSDKCDITYFLDGVTATAFGIKRSEVLFEESEEWDGMNFDTETDTVELKKALHERLEAVLTALSESQPVQKLSLSLETLGFSADKENSKQNG